jgi:hypothetical protein
MKASSESGECASEIVRCWVAAIAMFFFIPCLLGERVRQGAYFTPNFITPALSRLEEGLFVI